MIQLDGLKELSHKFGHEAAKAKSAALSGVVEPDLEKPSILVAYHDILLFMLAYPDNEETYRAAARELRRSASIARRLVAAGSGEELRETGIAHTEVVETYSRDIARWLSARFGESVAIDWRNESAGPGLDEAMPLLLAPVERDGLLTGQTTRRVIHQAGGKTNELRWILDRVDRLADDPGLVDQAWDRIALPLRWVLRSPNASITFARFTPRPVHFFRDGLERPRSLEEYPLPGMSARLTVRDAEPIIDTCKAVLAVRGRETDPVTVANPSETYLYRLDRGLDIAVIGMLPGRRLPIESYFGFVAARNRIPIAYGGGWVFFDRCEIGINVFDAFRGGESIHTLAHVIGVYRSLFRPGFITVAPGQIGAGNEEAIASGAYWAYDRLGFRPTDASLARLADRERARRKSSASYRSPAAILRRLARSGLILRLSGEVDDPLELEALAQVATDWVGQHHSGNLERAKRAALNRVIKALGVTDLHRWPLRKRQSFEQLSLLIAPIHDMARWPNRDKKSLVAVIRAKGGQQERSYALGLQRHRRLYEAWMRLAVG